jgi:hypothetical protein
MHSLDIPLPCTIGRQPAPNDVRRTGRREFTALQYGGMSERSQDESQRLPHVYISPDETVREVGARPLPPKEPTKRRIRKPGSKSGPVERIVIDEAVLNHARELAGQDLGRLVLRRDGSVIVANTPQQATRIRKEPTFGTFEEPESLSQAEDNPR